MRACGHVAARGEVADEVSGGGGQGGVGGGGYALEPQTIGVLRNLGVDIGGGAGHVAGTHRLATGGFHRLVEVARHVAGGRVAGMGARIMEFVAQRQRIGGAAGQEHLFAAHAARDLRQAHGIAGDAAGVHRIADRQVGIVRHHLGGVGERLFERIGGVVGGFVHRAVPVVLAVSDVLTESLQGCIQEPILG